jgi:hypothetical protein
MSGNRSCLAGLLLLVGVCVSSPAQVSLGARHGFGMGWSYFEDMAFSPGAVNGLHLIAPVGSLRVQAEMTMIPEVIDNGEGSGEFSLYSLEFPMLVRVPVSTTGPQWLELTLLVGPRLVFRFRASDGSQDLEWADLHKLDLGISAGAELGAVIGFYTVFLDLRVGAGALPTARGYQARSLLTSAAIGYRVTFPPRRRTQEEGPSPVS